MSAALGASEFERLESWLVERAEVKPPLQGQLIPGGLSNLTYRLEDAAGRAYILRRPPLHGVLASAHDVLREARIMQALAGSPVPVPEIIATTDDQAVLGAPFFVSTFVDGAAFRSAAVLDETLDTAQQQRLGCEFVDALARLHDLDCDEAGLGDLGTRADYLPRQLHIWKRQWAASRTRDLPLVDSLHARIKEQIPPQKEDGIVHGDFRVDNLIIDGHGRVSAVLDWELCALGDPLADLGVALAYWRERGEDALPHMADCTQASGLPTRAELADAYAAATGHDITDLPTYLAFGYWKVAVILEGVLARYESGAMGDRPVSEYESLTQSVERLAELSHDTLVHGEV